MNHEMDDEFKALCDAYSQSIPDKILKIEAAFEKLNKEWNNQNLMGFTSLIHKIAGSAGMYGYQKMSEISNKIENILDNCFETMPSVEIKNQLNELLSELKKASISSESNFSLANLEDVQTNLIYLLYAEQDYTFGKNWADKLNKQLSVYGYELSAFTNFDSFIAALKNKKPLALIINSEFLFNPHEVNMSDEHTKSLLQLYFKNNYTIFISNSGDFEKRLNSFRMGCRNFILLPFNITELTAELDNLKYLWKGEFKAIIVDDDEEILNHFSSLLSKAKIENKKIKSYKELENQLSEFQPDIFLFDLNMPDCNGIELAGVMRQRKKYEHIPIIYLSTEESKSVHLQALNVGADDFITKSTDPNFIIQTIRIRANRYKKIKMIMNKDNLTGAFNFEYVSSEIEKFIRLYQNTNYSLTIGVVEITNLGPIKNSYGYHASEQLLNNLYVLLNNQLDPSRIIGSYDSNKFIVIFPKTTNEEATKEISKIQEMFRSTLQYADGNAYSSDFNIGLATYQPGELLKDFIKKADSNLSKSKT